MFTIKLLDKKTNKSFEKNLIVFIYSIFLKK